VLMGKFATDACLDTMRRLNDNIPPETLPRQAELEAIAQAIGEIGERKRIADYGLEFVINGYLSGTMTPIANALSIAIQNLLRPTTYALGALTDSVRLTKGDRSIRDAYAMLTAAFEGFGADVQYFRQGWLRGYPIDIPGTLQEIASGTQRTVKEVRQSIADAYARQTALNEGLQEGTDDFAIRFDGLRKIEPTKEQIAQYVHEGYDYIRKAIPGKGGELLRIPTKLTVAIDEYGKARFRRQKVAQLASLKARQEAMEGGQLNQQRYIELFERYKREASVVSNDFGEMQRRLGKVFGQNEDDMLPYTTVREFTLDNTFQSRLYGLPAQILKLKTEGGDASRLLIGTMVPFIKTPWNILKEGATYVPGLPWLARPTYSTGGIPVKMSADELIPRQILGLGMFSMIMAMYASGRATGAPRDGDEAQAWRDQGVAPFALKLGDTWVPYQRLEPIATAFGLAADLKRAIEDYTDDPNPDKKLYGELFTDVMMGLKHHILSKSFMEGFSSMLEFATDPARVDEKVAAQLLRPLTPAIVNEAARIFDTYERQALSPIDKLQQRIPGLREQLPVEYGLIGDPRKTNMIQAITGFGIISESDRTPLQIELSRLNFTQGRVGDKLKRVGLSNEQTAAYRQLVAERLTPALSNLIESDAYQNLSDPRKKVVLENVTSNVKTAAGKMYFGKLYSEDPEVARKFYNQEILRKGLQENLPLKQ
jgi:hypothetical protein